MKLPQVIQIELDQANPLHPFATDLLPHRHED
jgi:hypothetical protein